MVLKLFGRKPVRIFPFGKDILQIQVVQPHVVPYQAKISLLPVQHLKDEKIHDRTDHRRCHAKGFRMIEAAAGIRASSLKPYLTLRYFFLSIPFLRSLYLHHTGNSLLLIVQFNKEPLPQATHINILSNILIPPHLRLIRPCISSVKNVHSICPIHISTIRK